MGQRQRRIILKDIYSRFDAPVLTLAFTRPSPINSEILSDFIEAWTALSLDIVIDGGIDSRQSQARRIQGFYQALGELKEFTVINEICDKVYRALLHERTFSEDARRTMYNSVFSEFGPNASKLLSPIRHIIGSFYSEKTSVNDRCEWLSLLTTWLGFPAKLPLESAHLQDAAIRGYLDTESRLAQLSISPEEDEVLPYLRSLFAWWFKDFNVDLIPKHGKGSVADIDSRTDTVCKATKYARLGLTPGLAYLANKGLRNEGLSPLNESIFLSDVSVERCSRTVFVPKTAKALRTISMEPVTLQYFQQAVMESMYNYFESHPYLKNHIKLTDQTFNQRLARIGSHCGSLATVDLSAASDSVSMDLVERVFSKTPQLLKWLKATRSPETLLPTGERIPLKKFAPMGSALCFPVECIIFAGIVEYTLNKMSGHSGSHNEQWSVYGDDIILPSYAYNELVRNLNALGFIVNQEKSFYKGPFRESCGKDYYEGVDVTRLFWRCRPLSGLHKDASPLSSWISAANNAAKRGLWALRTYILNRIKVLRAQGIWVPFSGDLDNSSCLWSPEPNNHHLNKKMIRFNKKLHKREGYFTIPTRESVDPIGKNIPEWILESAKLFEWHSERLLSSIRDTLCLPSIGKKILTASRTVLKRTWLDTNILAEGAIPHIGIAWLEGTSRLRGANLGTLVQS